MNSNRKQKNININENIICAGFGGQGIMTMGKVLANAGMMAGHHVTWLPSYGAEVRGGTANARVRINSAPIGSPSFLQANTAFIMNGPSLDKFEKTIAKKGLVILNSSMAERKINRKDLEIISVPLSDEAIKLGNVKVANMIAIGIFITKKKVFSQELLEKVIRTMAGDNKKLIDINIKALEKGIKLEEKW